MNMTAEQFVYWLQGFAELSGSASIDSVQWQIIKDHLALVLNKVTPNRPLNPGITFPAPMPPVFDPFKPGMPVITC